MIISLITASLNFLKKYFENIKKGNDFISHFL